MSDIKIITYQPKYKSDFVRLNEEWITTYFKLEESDIYTLNNVESYIIDKGGQVFLAIDQDERVLGCCALIIHPENNNSELAKMAVSPQAQGLGVGRKLGEALIGYAKENDIKHIFLEGNTRMEASIALYYKLGFEKKEINNPAYDRCNIMMEINL